jgi:hypothetical protein
MAEVLSEPQFQIFTHPKTRIKTGRIYFSALFLAEFYQIVIKWLRCSEINFEERDIKKYSDGSFRLYFKTPYAPEIAYLKLIKMSQAEYLNSLSS